MIASHVQELHEMHAIMLHIEYYVICSCPTTISTIQGGIEEKLARSVRNDIRNFKMEGGGSG